MIALLNKTQRAFAGTFLLVVVALACLANSVIARADPIKHVDGRIRYIVDLFDDDIGKLEKLSDVNSLIVWKKSKADQMIEEVAKLRGVEIIGSTSLVGISFTAYLTEKQLEQFSNDKRVKLITPDFYIRPSAIPWTPSYYYYQQTPWGIRALGGNTASSNGIATVYIVDTGVEMHNELSGLSASNRLTAIATATNGQPVNPTGCYPHATHVAGIIGAAANFDGVVGVLPGVKLVSIAIGDKNSSDCIDPYLPLPAGYLAPSGSIDTSGSGIGYGLDKVFQMVLVSQRVGIVNLSFNGSGGQFSSNGTLGMKLLQLATPISYPGWFEYPGAFIAQSAGNNYVDACTSAYNATSSSDGIMVVGALDANGQRVVPMNGSHGFRQRNSNPNFPISVEDGFNEPGSNYGNCVEVWAPGQLVLSTWTGGGYSMLSGTSMAAPHIAGLAAWLLEANGGNYNSQTLEASVRAHLSTISASNLALG